MKRPWLAVSGLCLIAAVGSAVVGLESSFRRIADDAEMRAREKIAASTSLAEIENMDRPGMVGLATGAILLVGSIATFVVHRRGGRERLPNKSPKTNALQGQ